MHMSATDRWYERYKVQWEMSVRDLDRIRDEMRMCHDFPKPLPPNVEEALEILRLQARFVGKWRMDMLTALTKFRKEELNK